MSDPQQVLDAMDAQVRVLRETGSDAHANELQALRDQWASAVDRQALETHPMYRFPIKDMLARGWIFGETTSEIEASVLRFFECDSVAELVEMMG